MILPVVITLILVLDLVIDAFIITSITKLDSIIMINNYHFGSYIKNILFLCLFAIILIGCKPRNESELYGTYIADYKIAREKIILYKDKTYMQEVMLKKTSKVYATKGTWFYKPNTGYVVLNENFMFVLDGFQKFDPKFNQPCPGPADLPADKYFCWILLGVAEDVLYKAVQKSGLNFW
jgi:hypothetical protein